jgi:hypothetical protein
MYIGTIRVLRNNYFAIRVQGAGFEDDFTNSGSDHSHTIDIEAGDFEVESVRSGAGIGTGNTHVGTSMIEIIRVRGSALTTKGDDARALRCGCIFGRGQSIVLAVTINRGMISVPGVGGTGYSDDNHSIVGVVTIKAGIIDTVAHLDQGLNCGTGIGSGYVFNGTSSVERVHIRRGDIRAAATAYSAELAPFLVIGEFRPRTKFRLIWGLPSLMLITGCPRKFYCRGSWSPIYGVNHIGRLTVPVISYLRSPDFSRWRNQEMRDKFCRNFQEDVKIDRSNSISR